MNILIVKLSAFGDIIHALPALDDILIHPEVDQVHWLVDQRYGFVSEVFPAQVIVHQVALKGNHPIQSAWQSIRRLRQIPFDAVIDLQGLIKSAALARACGAGAPVFAFDIALLREKVSAILTTNIPFHAQDKHVVQQYRRIAAAPFQTPSQRPTPPQSPMPYAAPHIQLTKSNCIADRNLLRSLQLTGKQYVILHAAGGWQTKQLPEQTWISIARALIKRNIQAVFSWGNQTEKKLAQHLSAQCHGYALPERLNMSALVALIQGCRAIVGADTGLLHLAAALNQPTITFWGPSAAWNSAPITVKATASTQGVKHWHIESKPDCGPCFKRTCNQFVCMDAINADTIIRILHEL